jgi:hypothetical protein
MTNSTAGECKVTSLHPPLKIQRFALPSHHVFLRKSHPARHDDDEAVF